jgi:hypothetical protein
MFSIEGQMELFGNDSGHNSIVENILQFKNN